jgi:hypothetical protein
VKEKWFVRLPFSVYFGWITIATIAEPWRCWSASASTGWD